MPRVLELMALGDLPDFEAVYHPDAVNREALTEPPACRRPGPAGYLATALWLRGMLADRSFATSQTHWCRLAEDRIMERWANRDDQGMAVQLGWVPPSLPYLVRSEGAPRRARRRGA